MQRLRAGTHCGRHQRKGRSGRLRTHALKAQLDGSKIEIKDEVHFATGSDVILEVIPSA